jgi:hypothetical protein
MRNHEINIHIDRIVLDGITLSAHDEPRFREVLQTELHRLITSEGLPGTFDNGANVPRVSSEMGTPAQSNPTRLGTQLAQATYKGMKK